MSTISSIVVEYVPKYEESIIRELESLPQVEVHKENCPENKLILLLECSSLDEELNLMKKIQKIKGVIVANMSFNYQDLEGERAAIFDAEKSAKAINEKSDHSYSGALPKDL